MHKYNICVTYILSDAFNSVSPKIANKMLVGGSLTEAIYRAKIFIETEFNDVSKLSVIGVSITKLIS